MKKINMNNKGFTLIELLAVIVIMGILMMIAIPAISRAILNARKDTFATTAKKYLDAVRNEVFGDNVVCGADEVVASAMPSNGDPYYIEINSADKNGDAQKLLESGGKSPFGSAELQGYVVWVKYTNTTKYSIALTDTGKHGFTNLLNENQLKRRNINSTIEPGFNYTEAPSVTIEADGSTLDKKATKCKLAE